MYARPLVNNLLINLVISAVEEIKILEKLIWHDQGKTLQSIFFT